MLCAVHLLEWRKPKTKVEANINSNIEAAATIALGQSIGSVRIYSVQGLGFQFSCVQTFCNFFSSLS